MKASKTGYNRNIRIISPPPIWDPSAVPTDLLAAGSWTYRTCANGTHAGETVKAAAACCTPPRRMRIKEWEAPQKNSTGPQQQQPGGSPTYHTSSTRSWPAEGSSDGEIPSRRGWVRCRVTANRRRINPTRVRVSHSQLRLPSFSPPAVSCVPHMRVAWLYRKLCFRNKSMN